MKYSYWVRSIGHRYIVKLTWTLKLASSVKLGWGVITSGVVICVSLFLTAVVHFSIKYWDWLSEGESNASTVRNIAFATAAAIALLLTVWRSSVAERQTETAQQGLLNERYQKGAEMLGSEVLSVRLGGIYALDRLAEEDPGQYHFQIMYLFCAFVRHPTEEKEVEDAKKIRELGLREAQTSWDAETKPMTPRPDIQAVMSAIGYRSDTRIALEKATEGLWDFRRANLSALRLHEANLFNALLMYADLSDARLSNGDLSNAILFNANLAGADLSEANLSEARGLTQRQLNQACADTDKPPVLDKALDAETGEPLVWRGKPLRDDE